MGIQKYSNCINKLLELIYNEKENRRISKDKSELH
jgi:hypothetical protein